MKKLFFLLFLLLLCCIPVIMAANNNLNNAVIVRIIDGDTYKVNFNGKEQSLRIIGVDAPESKPNKKAFRDSRKTGQDIATIMAMGKRATIFVETLIKPGDTIKIEFDVQQYDRYGRLLGYVYLPNGKMLNEELVRAGYANLMTVPPNVKYQSRFLELYKQARENKRGLWGE